jgi:hypothetical protein
MQGVDHTNILIRLGLQKLPERPLRLSLTFQHKARASTRHFIRFDSWLSGRTRIKSAKLPRTQRNGSKATVLWDLEPELVNSEGLDS